VSGRVQSVQQKQAPNGRPLTKADKRALAKEARAAAARAAAAKRRWRKIGVTVATVAAVAALIWAVVLLVRSGNTATPSSAAATPTPAATAPAFPQLPAGADPALGTKPVTSAGTGDLTKLAVTTVVQGQGVAVKAGDNITVNYVGVSYKTGAEFDASWKRSQTFPFVLGKGNVIPGWDQGLVGVKVGSRVQLDIPASLAYGDNPTDGSPAGPLRFVVDVLGVQ
jgi:peptidylprolyl isomerase